MINVMCTLSSKIYPFRYLFLVVGFIAMSGFAYIVFKGSKELDVYILPLVSSFGWCIALFGIASTFQKAPPIVISNDSFFTRLRKRFSRFLMWLWSTAFFILSIMMLYISYKTFGFSLVGGS